ncbi:MAG: hypothetical protein CME86_14535 [Herbaspirillum sp.]|nr:hypothetical protein [Herbaspirillum sp.]
MTGVGLFLLIVGISVERGVVGPSDKQRQPGMWDKTCEDLVLAARRGLDGAYALSSLRPGKLGWSGRRTYGEGAAR